MNVKKRKYRKKEVRYIEKLYYLILTIVTL